MRLIIQSRCIRLRYEISEIFGRMESSLSYVSLEEASTKRLALVVYWH